MPSKNNQIKENRKILIAATKKQQFKKVKLEFLPPYTEVITALFKTTEEAVPADKRKHSVLLITKHHDVVLRQ
jgi:hypothetical protein